MFGKKLYKSKSLRQFQVIYLSLAFFLLINLLIQTKNSSFFQGYFSVDLSGILKFHLHHPQEFLIYILTILVPAIYYSFIRGITFYERGMIINKGLPFFNKGLSYEDIAEYKVIHPSFLLGIKRKDVKEEFVFTVRNIDRVIAILDQQKIKGKLGDDELKKTLTVNKKFVIFFISFSILVFSFQHFGLFDKILR